MAKYDLNFEGRIIKDVEGELPRVGDTYVFHNTPDKLDKPPFTKFEVYEVIHKGTFVKESKLGLVLKKPVVMVKNPLVRTRR